MRARRSPSLYASALTLLKFAEFLSFTIGKKLSLTLWCQHCIFICTYVFRAWNRQPFVQWKFFDFFWRNLKYRIQFIAGTALKIRIFWFDCKTAKFIEKLYRSAFWKCRATPCSDRIPVLFFLPGWCRSYWFFRFETAAFEFYEPD